MRLEVNGRLETILKKVLGLTPEQATLDLSMDDLPAWDSLRHMELIAAIEAEFGLELTFDEIIRMRTVRCIQDVLTAHGRGG